MEETIITTNENTFLNLHQKDFGHFDAIKYTGKNRPEIVELIEERSEKWKIDLSNKRKSWIMLIKDGDTCRPFLSEKGQYLCFLHDESDVLKSKSLLRFEVVQPELIDEILK